MPILIKKITESAEICFDTKSRNTLTKQTMKNETSYQFFSYDLFNIHPYRDRQCPQHKHLPNIQFKKHTYSNLYFIVG